MFCCKSGSGILLSPQLKERSKRGKSGSPAVSWRYRKDTGRPILHHLLREIQISRWGQGTPRLLLLDVLAQLWKFSWSTLSFCQILSRNARWRQKQWCWQKHTKPLVLRKLIPLENLVEGNWKWSKIIITCMYACMCNSIYINYAMVCTYYSSFP